MTIQKIKGVAVAEHARGDGIGAALLRRCVQTYEQLGYRLLYGQFSIDSGLESYYTRQGFQVLDPHEFVALDPLFGLPINISGGPGERLFLRWNLRR